MEETMFHVKLLDRIAEAYREAADRTQEYQNELLAQFFALRPIAEREAGCAFKYKGIDY